LDSSGLLVGLAGFEVDVCECQGTVSILGVGGSETSVDISNDSI